MTTSPFLDMPRQLRREWAAACLAAALMIFAFAMLINAAWPDVSPLIALAVIVPISVAELWHLYRLLPHNHRADDAIILPSFGLGTWLTIVRSILLALLGGLLVLPHPMTGWPAWLPSGLYLSAAIADYVDGIAARVSNHVTLLGQEFDLDLDALGILIAPLLGVLYGQFPVWYLLVSAARYLFLIGVWRLKRSGKPVAPLTSSPARRYLAGFQMGLSAAILMPLFSPPGTTIVATLFMIPFMIGFYRDWLVVSQSIDSQSSSYQATERALKKVFIEWLPLPLRVSLLVLSAIIVFGSDAPQDTVSLVLISAGALFAAAGIISRLAAFVVLVVINLNTQGQMLSVFELAIIVVSAVLMLTGSGKGALWRPEEVFLRAHVGERKAGP